MKIAIASDHRGIEVKQRIVASLRKQGHEVIDRGPEGTESVDYPDYAIPVAEAVGSKQVDRGILICGTGIGMCIAANKVPGVRAAPCHDSITAEMSRRHNDANILCLSADLLGDQLIDRMLHIWLETEFEGGRHALRADSFRQIRRSTERCASREPGRTAGASPGGRSGKFRGESPVCS